MVVNATGADALDTCVREAVPGDTLTLLLAYAPDERPVSTAATSLDNRSEISLGKG